MWKLVDQNVLNFDSCQRTRISRHATFQVLQPLQVTENPREDILMDLLVGLPECPGFNAIWVVVD